MGKASTDKEIKSAQNAYDEAVKKNTGLEGYNNLVNSGIKTQSARDTKSAYNTGNNYGSSQSNVANDFGYTGAAKQTTAGTQSAINKGNQMNAAQNAQAQKYAGQQAAAAAAGAQSQATTAARAAGMNKAQAAMMGSQQNANAFQNAYGNAYNTQLGNAANNQNAQLANYNNAFENNANRYNSNANQYAAMQNANNQYQQSLAASMMGANVSGIGNQVSMAQAQDAQNFRQGGLFSDERLKHYRECSKKVVMKTPSKIQSLKITTKGE